MREGERERETVREETEPPDTSLTHGEMLAPLQDGRHAFHGIPSALLVGRHRVPPLRCLRHPGQEAFLPAEDMY